MSWLKKIISKFSTEEIEEQEQLRKMDNKNHDSPSMETRMTYQYPKGNFRFPLIEDTPNQRNKAVKEPDKSQNRKQHSRKAEKPNRHHEKDEVSKGKTHRGEERNKQKVESQLKQPFRPTHIPSPVFGFQRPEKVNTEYELQDSFLRKSSMEDGSQAFEKINENTLKEEIPSALAETEETEQSCSDAAEIPNVENTEPLLFIEEEIREDEKQLSSEKTEALQELEVTEGSREATEQETIEKEEEHHSVETEMPLELESMEFPSMETYIEEETFADEREQEAPDDPENTAELEGSHTPTAVEEHHPHSTEYEEQGQIETESEIEDTPKREKKRAAMPFNVLMLKNDRKSWQEKQERKEQVPTEKETPVQDVEINTQSSNRDWEHAEKETSAVQVEEEMPPYYYPELSLLQPPVIKTDNEEWLEEQKQLLNETLANFNVQAYVVHVSQGPAVTRFEVQPERGVKVSKITNLSDDIKLSMAARDIRMEAPIPGKRSIGIEIPNQDSRPVQISEIIGDPSFLHSESPLTAVLGLDISGKPIVTDLQKMPHGLIAGATGSGKSVCINSILVSLLYKARPDELKLLLIDPKMVELAPYNHIPHLVSPVITDVKAATASLKWAVDEMERRYELFAHASVRNIGRFNEIAEENRQFNQKLPYIVIIIDELADLMMMAPHEVEESICRIAQKARACGIHLIIATQRPSVDVITGLIKANVPTRVAFSVSSQVDSRTIIDISGAEKLLGRGDMLFLGSGSSKPVRLQGTFVSDEEIDRVIGHVRSQGDPDYLFEQEELLKKTQVQEEEDELYLECCEFVIKHGSASTSMLQRQFRIGYNRAARLIDMLEQQGVISGANGSKPRDVLISEHEWDAMHETMS